MWAELLPDAVDEELDAAAAGTNVYVEVLPLDEKLSELTQEAPAAAFVELLCPHEIQRSVATRTTQRMHFGHSILRTGDSVSPVTQRRRKAVPVRS